MAASREQRRKTSANYLKSLQMRFESESRNWPDRRHQLIAFASWKECSKYLRKRNTRPRSSIPRELRPDTNWCSGADARTSQFWAVAQSPGYVLSEFFANDIEHFDEVISAKCLRAFYALAEHAWNILDRNCEWLDSQTSLGLRACLAPDVQVPAVPWVSFLYKFVASYYTPVPLAAIKCPTESVSPSRASARLLRQGHLLAELPAPNVADNEALFVKARQIIERLEPSERSEIKMKVTISPPPPAQERLPGHAIVARIKPDGAIALEQDVFSTSWAVIDIVCQWFQGISQPIRTPIDADFDEAPTESKRKCGKRDELWQRWSREGRTCAEIRENWNDISDDGRREISPDCWHSLPGGRRGSDRVKSALARLRKRS